MLGAHGMVGKGILLEEAVRVPLVMRYDGVMPAGKVVKEVCAWNFSVGSYTARLAHSFRRACLTTGISLLCSAR